MFFVYFWVIISKYEFLLHQFFEGFQVSAAQLEAVINEQI
jgi:hypothetical protein